MPPQVKTPVGDAPLIPLILIGAGGYLAWFGVHYWRSDVKWPADPVKSVLTGKPLPSNVPSLSPEETAALQLATAAQGSASGTGQAAGTTTAGGRGSGTPAGTTASAAANQNIGKMLAASYGWSTGQQWQDLVSLWNQESGWSNTADTRKSGLDPPDATVFAYGIPQARPYSKMPKAGWPPDKGGSADPTSQIRWGLAYIKATYGSPSAAWAFDKAHGLQGY